MTNTDEQITENVKQAAGQTKMIGFLLVILGILALASPIVAAASVGIIVAVSLIIAGVAQLFQAFGSDRKIAGIIVGLLTIVAGRYMWSAPGLAIATLTLFIAVFLIITGIVEALMSFQLKGQSGWTSGLWAGVLSVLLGLALWTGFPVSGLLAIGILVGLRLLFAGLTCIMVGSAVKKAV